MVWGGIKLCKSSLFSHFSFQPQLSVQHLPSTRPFRPYREKCRGRWKGVSSLFPGFPLLPQHHNGIPFQKMLSFFIALSQQSFLFHPFFYPEENCKMHITISGEDYQIRLIGDNICFLLNLYFAIKYINPNALSGTKSPGILFLDPRWNLVKLIGQTISQYESIHKVMVILIDLI